MHSILTRRNLLQRRRCRDRPKSDRGPPSSGHARRGIRHVGPRMGRGPGL